MSEYVYIYLLKHPFLNEGYIGQSNNLVRRKKEHLRDKDITPKTDWLREMKRERVVPQMEPLKRVLKMDADRVESELTKQYLKKGWAIMNSTNRGIGTYERVTEWITLTNGD